MKISMKRFISVAISFALASSMLGVPAFADEVDNTEGAQENSPVFPALAANESVVTSTEGTADEADGQDQDQSDESFVIEGFDDELYSEETLVTAASEEDDASAAYTNKVSVVITDAKPFDTGSTTFQVSLSNHGFVNVKTSKDGSSYKGVATFDGVEPGSYTIEVSAPQYHEYTQPLYVYEDGSFTYKVSIHTFLYSAQNQNAHPGVIFYGDVTNDNQIGDDDIDELVGTLSNEGYSESMDLSHTGEVSLRDLQILSIGYGEEPITASGERSLIFNGDNPDPVDPVNPDDGKNPENVVVSDNVTVAEGSTIGNFESAIGNADTSQSIVLKSEEKISQANPIVIELNNLDAKLTNAVEGITIAPPAVTDEAGNVEENTLHPNAVTGGVVVVEYTDEDGNDQYMEITFGEQEPIAAVAMLAQFVGLAPEKAYAALASAYIDSTGTIIVDFGNQIAIKKVTLKITKTNNNGDGNLNLAEISSVEFLNEMQDRIDEPEMDIPTDLSGEAGDKQFSISWSQAPNCTGYEVSISANGKQAITSTTSTSLVVTSFAGDPKGKIINDTTYTVKVQSVNSSWRSGWCESIQLTPRATKAPDRPDNVSASGGYKCVKVAWKAMEDTTAYNVYYRQKTSDGSGIWTQCPDVTNNSYTIYDLQDLTEYQVYVKGKNSIGESAPSDTAVATTISINPTQMSNYKLINTQDANGHYLNNIKTASVPSCQIVDSPLDASSSTALGIFDGDFTSYAKKADWDLGCSYNRGNHGVIVEFTQNVNIGFISFAASQDNIQYSGMSLMAADANGAMQQVPGVSFNNIPDGHGRQYTLVAISGGITTNKIILGMNRYIRYIDIAEMRIHGFDSIEQDIDALYADTFHIKLADGVDSSRIDTLQARLDTPDSASGEYYPYKKSAQLELNFARQLLEDENAGLGEVVELHATINDSADSNKNLGISGLNSWQPLGYVAATGDTITAYVASANGATGQSKVQLYIGQQYAESNNPPSYGGTFPTGRMVYTIPDKSSKDCERGGQLYAKYSGTNASEKWAIRIMGATPIASLDMYGDLDDATKLERSKSYVEKLDAQVADLKKASGSAEEHKKLHDAYSEGNRNVDYGYSNTECILNATEIMTDAMLYSVPALKVHAAIGESGTLEERAQRLVTYLDGSDQLFEVFYQHKGLVDDSFGAPATNTAPANHLNIRCMRMFSGAFMYAAGNHIGVGYNESANFSMLRPISDAATTPGGQRADLSDGRFFGWGTAHEIGHNINDGRYAHAEITNNYFAALCRMVNEGTTRWNYDAVYDRVSSGATGRTGSVFTQLAMYWQLMLAYDNNEIYTIYDNLDGLLVNRFFARVDSYARNTSTAPVPEGGIPLSVNAGEMQNIIRLASAAAQKDLSSFFTRWGLQPSDDTIAFVSQYPAEERALQYITDDTVKWARANPNAARVTGADVVNASVSQSDSIVDINMGFNDASILDSLVGYEIMRNYYESGVVKTEIAGFAKAGENGSATFKDDVKHLGNRTVFYTIRAVDKFMDYSNAFTTDTLKLDGSGLYATDTWTASTNMTSDQDSTLDEPSEEPSDDNYVCPGEGEADLAVAIESTLSGTAEQPYVGRSAEDDPYVLIDMKKVNAISKIRYTPQDASKQIRDYEISVSSDGIAFEKIAQGTFELDENGNAEVFFYGNDEKWIVTESARFIKLTAPGQSGKDIAIQHLGVYGPSGDNVDMLSVDGIPVIGRLAEDYVYDQSDPETYVIKAGSIVFTGSYTGNPAYNVVVLYDENGRIVGAPSGYENDDEYVVSNQIVLADTPSDADAKLGKTNDGRWVYWIDPTTELPAKVRAELYRVDNALTNEGQRLTSDSLFQVVQSFDNLPSITFKSK